VDIAQLGIEINSTSAVQATTNLDAFAASATNAASANERLAGSASSAAGAQSAAAGATSSAAASTSTATTAADRLIASLEKQIILFNATDTAIAAYNGNMAKMTAAEFEHYQAQTAVLSQLQAESAQLQQFYAIQEAGVVAGEKFIASLTTQSQTIGLSKTALLEYKAAQLGVSEQAAPLIASIEAQTAAMAEQAATAAVLGESEDAATARISAMIAVSLQQAAVANDNTIATERYAASVDATAAAATAAEKAQASLVVSTEAVVAAQRQAATQIDAADTTISGGAEKVVNALERQILALTAGKEALAQYDAQAAGLSVTETELVVAKTRELEATKAQVAAGAEMAKAYLAEAAAADVVKGSTSGLTTEILVLFRELGRGDLSRFGGSLTRLISLAGATSLLFNPLTLSVIALTAAFVKVENEDSKLNQALILTNGYAGETASGLKIMAETVAQGGATIGVANEALAELAATGRVTSAEIEKLGVATADAATYSGVSVKQMVGEFTKLQEEPLKASVKLNEQYHYLTVATYDQINALLKQGDAVGAAQVAQEAFADASIKADERIKASQGPLLTFWQDLKKTISGTVEALGSLGATAGPAEILARDQANRAARAPIGQWTPEDQERITRETAAVNAANTEARKKAADAEQVQAVISAKERYEAFNSHFWTPQERRAKEYQKYLDEIATPLGLSAEQQLADEQKIADKYKDKKVPGMAGISRAEASQNLKAVQDQLKLIQDAYKDHQKNLDEDYRAGLLSSASYYNQERTLDDQHLKDLQDNYAKQIATLRQGVPGETAAQRINDQTKINSLQAEATKAVTDYLSTYQKIGDAEIVETKKREAAIKDYNDRLKEQLATQKNAADLQVASLSQGGRESGLAAQINAAQKAYDSAAVGIQRTFDRSKQTADDKAQYDAQLAAQKNYESDVIALDRETYARISTAQQDWLGGAKKAWADWSDSANNVNGQVGNTFTTALNGMTDALTTFATTGKISFTSLADSIIKDLARIAIQIAVSKGISEILGAFASAGVPAAGGTGAAFGGSASGVASSGVSTSFAGSALGYATGGFISGAGSGTSDSINAKLSNGEFVVNAAATAQNRSLLEAMNGGKGSSGQRHFATGGFVGSSPTTVSGGTSIVFNISSGSGAGTAQSSAQQAGNQKVKTDALQRELESTVLEVIRKHSEPGGQVNKIIKQVSK